MREDLKELISDTIRLSGRNVIFFKNITSKPLLNGEVDCEERIVFNNIFELVNFFNNLKDENIVGYYEVEDDKSDLYVYLKGVE
jgi:hypothetical protein